ncbi:MAG: energy transducer TonB [Deltaproteobacteria bacterium]|nr:energy transducer TonB [Deltaproteobacteria bacterium]MBI3386724.1 energy transducer TonB [Deltaproteobacteria bacterium]
MSQTFVSFGHYGDTERVPRQWFAALFTSSGVYAGIVLAAVALGFGTKELVSEKPVDVTFVEKIVKEEPPPPPPPVAEAKPQPPPAAAPVVRPDQKIRQLDKPPPPKELVAPKEMPQAAPLEADPSQDKGIAVFGEPGDGDPAGLEGGSKDGVAGGQVGAITLPEDAVPPLPAKSNAVPAYPQEARANGQTGTVILKVVILANGRVADVQVMRGDEPFVSAAVQAVKTWKYEPARYKGLPITVYRIIQIPFKLNA